MKYALILMFVASAALGSSTAVAQEGAVAELNAEGMSAFADGDYAGAAEIFGRAYAMEPRPELLKNAAVAWYRADRCDEAVSSATSYLRNAGESDGAKQMRALVGACRVRLAEEAVKAGSLDLAENLLERAEASSPEDSLLARIDVLRVQIAKRRAADRQREPDSVEVTPLDETDVTPQPLEVTREVEPPAPAPKRSPAGPVLVASGSAVLAGAAVYHLVGVFSMEPKFIEVAEAGTDRDRYERLDRSLRRANVIIPIAYAVGAVTVATGVSVWIATSPSGDVAVSLKGTF